MIKLLMADDHAIVRQGLKQFFALTEDVQVAAEASNGSEVISLITEQDFDVLLLDMSMPGISGVNLISRVQTCAPKLPIIVLTMYNEPQIAKRALNAGVNGYVTKDCDPEILLLAIRKVVKGERFIEPVLAGQLVFEQVDEVEKQKHHILSERELLILRYLANGKAINQIAEDLSISNKTVSTYKARLMQKMNFQNHTDIVCYAIEFNLIE